MGRQIRALIAMSFATEEKVWYKRNKEAKPERESEVHSTKKKEHGNILKKGSQY